MTVKGATDHSNSHELRHALVAGEPKSTAHVARRRAHRATGSQVPDGPPASEEAAMEDSGGASDVFAGLIPCFDTNLGPPRVDSRDTDPPDLYAPDHRAAVRRINVRSHDGDQ